MQFFSYTKPKMIVADEGKQIRAVNDVYLPEYINDEGNLIKEHFPYYTTVIFVPDSYTEEQAKQDYIEESIDY